MAYFIPTAWNYSDKPISEQMVLDFLEKKLPDDWVVFHSFKYVGHDNLNHKWDGEVDFLLFHEGMGFLVLEVKGGIISYTDGQWRQNGRLIYPIDQARKNKYAIMNILQEKWARPVPLRYAHAVCFPDCTPENKEWPPEADGIVITGDDLHNIEDIAVRLIEGAALPSGICGKITVQEVIDILSPEFEYVPKLKKLFYREKNQFSILTQQQSMMLHTLKPLKKVVFEGCAGTGKTSLAIRKALDEAAFGGKVLLLCFNELLAKKIKGVCNAGFGRITVGAFFDFCVELMKIPREEYDRYRSNPKLYSTVLPDLMDRYLEQCEVIYDAIIVDEGQDFNGRMWQILEKMLVPGGVFYIFHDPDQNIFREALDIPVFDIPPLPLLFNCRNTRRIFDALEPYRTLNAMMPDSSPLGSNVVERRGNCRQLLAEELHRIFVEEKVMQSDVVVLGAHSLHNTCLGDDPVVGEYRLVEQPSNWKSKDVAYYTYMKFKGCESNVVIVFDVDENDSRWNDRGLYTAMSRAVSHLVVIRRGDVE